MFKSVDASSASSTISTPVIQIIEIPDASLNEKLIPANDNHEPSFLSTENLQAGSILAPRDYIPGRSPLIITALLCLIVVAAVVVGLAI